MLKSERAAAWPEAALPYQEGTLPSYCILSLRYVLVAQRCGAAWPWMLVQRTLCSIRWDDKPDRGPVSQRQHPVGLQPMSKELLRDCQRVHNNPLTPVTTRKLSFTAAGWVSSPEVWNNITSPMILFIALIQRWVLPLTLIPGAYGVDRQCHKMFWQMTFPETMTHGLKTTQWA